VTDELAWGAPLGSIVQYAYFVEEMEAAIGEWVERLGVGPWFAIGPFTPATGRYRGEPTEAVFTIAQAFAGRTIVELVEQHDDAPSVFNELGSRGYGFHHWGVMTKSFDEEVARYRAMGYEEAYFDTLPTTGMRVMYLDARRDLPGMIEVLEHTAAQERVYAEYYEASLGWDGTDPIRRD